MSDEILYVLDRQEILTWGKLVLGVWARLKGPHGKAHVLVPVPIRDAQFVWDLESPDRDIGHRLSIVSPAGRRGYERGIPSNRCTLGPRERDAILPWILETGRLWHRDNGESELRPLSKDEGTAWDFRMSVEESPDGAEWEVKGVLVRGEERMAPDDPWLLLSGGWVVAGGKLSRLLDHGAFSWLSTLRREGTFRVTKERESELLERLWNLPGAPPIDWPDALKLREERSTPRPLLRVKRSHDVHHGPDLLRATLCFHYGDETIEYRCPAPAVPNVAERKLLLRDSRKEKRHRRTLAEQRVGTPPLALVRDGSFSLMDLAFEPDALPGIVRKLTARGWEVEAEGKIYRPRNRFKVRVSSGIDWFDLEVDAVFGDQRVPLPRLLKAIERGRDYVILDDGTRGILPETWLGEYKLLLALGRLREGRLRFQRSQLVLLDRLISSESDASWDPDLEAAHAALADLDRIPPEDPVGDFRGELRPYQKEGLAWLRFLERAGLGGCLADDMGLGKTVQVLAFLEGRRRGGEPIRPSLAVVPRSLVFNWISEARRFTPGLRVLEYLGPRRQKSEENFRRFDLVLTTYGTLVRDATFLKDCAFDCAILDEAQAIKNASSTYARAARLIKASHRLALTGTPIENHLGEIRSLFEFLDPGLLGGSRKFNELFGDPEGGAALHLISRLLRPLILRRKKREVEATLPERVDQTVFCDLEPRQRRDYDELRLHYRSRVLEDLEDPRARFRILEGLLRLRQAACHPGLLDGSRIEEPGGKLGVLLDRLAEIDAEGNKALVFSQFTALLGILRKRLEARRIAFEYLDGRTRDRAARVERFQNDPDCRLFLISLKAGGVGLNLTAAGYVFLLDPWWNPAVEAQAIDRAHRIGQRQTVFAYRLIARGTVEERILELQDRKRRLAEEILSGAGGGLRDLRREDIELLFS
jgi:superfamily II DNA or RNA helicase